MVQVGTDRMAVIAALKNGAVGVMATDTIYGVVACAAHEVAVTRLYELKHRQNKPGTIIAASTHDLAQLGIPLRYMRAVEQYWPGSISIVVPSTPALRYLDQGKGSLAVRVPADDSLHEFLVQTGPLLTSSANHPAEPPATTCEQAQNYFGGDVDFYVDGGDLSSREPSTVIRVIDDAIEVLRAGAVKIDESGEVA